MMIETYEDGLFFHPKGPEPTAVAKRIASGDVNPRLDDIFTIALKETKAEYEAKKNRAGKLEDRLVEIKQEILRLNHEMEVIADRTQHQHEAIQKYQRGEELNVRDRELLTPECKQLVADQRKADTLAEFDKYSDTFKNLESDDWGIEGKRIKDGYIYVTIKRAMAKQVSPEDRVTKKVAKAMAKFFTPSFERVDRISRHHLASFSPINPGAG